MTFFGKYRGKVEDNLDPLLLGRLQVSVPAVLPSGVFCWAMPCVPYAGEGVGFFAIPPLKANVWVEFEGGNPDLPIWSGCFWGEGETPGVGLADVKVFKTESISLTLNDIPEAGGFTLEVVPPAVPIPLKMVFDSQGIELATEDASIKLTLAEITITHTSPAITVQPEGISAASGDAQLSITPAAIAIENGMGSVEVSPASVSVNKGALEVT